MAGPTMTLEAAAMLHDEVGQAQRLLTDATARRNEAVWQLLQDGTRNVDIARRLGLSPTRVTQIAAAADQARTLARAAA